MVSAAHGSLAAALTVSLTLAPLVAQAQQATSSAALSFENADIHTVIKHVGKLTGITFVFDPEEVKGKVSLLAPKGVLPAEALTLLCAICSRLTRLQPSEQG